MIVAMAHATITVNFLYIFVWCSEMSGTLKIALFSCLSLPFFSFKQSLKPCGTALLSQQLLKLFKIPHTK